jgi:ATP/maltotriose-dependent transcriptional regulator MalT/DNA-binding SARP family transcriptional activator
MAKTTRPNVADAVPRPQLFRQLDRGRKRPLTWVCGPPGAGKTTLVASYLESRELPAIWYQVDLGDADVATFFYYLGLAAPRRRRRPPLLAPGDPSLTLFARRFFRELYSRFRRAFALVLDNYQELPAESDLHEVVHIAVSELPAGGRILAVSRTEPPPSLAALQVARAIDCIEASDLRLTATEIRRLARRLVPRPWPESAIRKLCEVTDGWAAGVVLLAPTVSVGSRIEHAAPTAHEVLFHYFASEVFRKAAPDAQDVLLRTAYLPGVTASMAVALTGRPTAGAILATLARQHYFTTRHNGPQAVYQYHGLFRQFLLSEAERRLTPAERTDVRRHAARLLEEADQPEGAWVLLRDARDWPGLARSIGERAAQLLAQGRVRTLETWVAAFPQKVVEEDPWLLYWRSVSRLLSRPTDAVRDSERALRLFRETRQAEGAFLSWAQLALAIGVAAESTAPLERHAASLDDLRRELGDIPSGPIEARVAHGMLLAIAWRQPHHPDATRWAERALELTEHYPDPILKVTIVLAWITYQIEMGRFTSTLRSLHWLQGVVASAEASALEASLARRALALLECFVLGTPLQAVRTIREGLLPVRKAGFQKSTTHLVYVSCGIDAALSAGELDRATEWLSELGANLDPAARCVLGLYEAGRVWEALLRRDFTAALAHLEPLEKLGPETGWPQFDATIEYLGVQVRHALADQAGARSHLGRLEGIARAVRSPYLEYMALLARAQVELDGGEPDDALRAALALGRSGGYWNHHGFSPEVMARLCARALEAGMEVAHVKELIRRRALTMDPASLEADAWPWPIQIFSLGTFEVVREGEPIRFSHKVQRKPLALLKSLVAASGRAVSEEILTDALWPDADGDAARAALSSALHRLRGLLGRDEAIERKDGKLTLVSRFCWVDVWAVERLLARAETAAVGVNGAQPCGLTRKALELYRGPFLGDEAAQIPQGTALADRIRRRLLRQIVALARDHEQSGRWQEAVDGYEEAVRVDPCAEDVYRSLMSVYRNLGRPTDVEETYRRCRENLAAHLAIAPAPETEALLETPFPRIRT